MLALRPGFLLFVSLLAVHSPPAPDGPAAVRLTKSLPTAPHDRFHAGGHVEFRGFALPDALGVAAVPGGDAGCALQADLQGEPAQHGASLSRGRRCFASVSKHARRGVRFALFRLNEGSRLGEVIPSRCLVSATGPLASQANSPIWEMISPEAKALVRKLIVVDPKKRITGGLGSPGVAAPPPRASPSRGEFLRPGGKV